MSTTSKVAGTALVPKGGEDISRLVEARRGKNFFYHRKNSLMRYKLYIAYEINANIPEVIIALSIISPAFSAQFGKIIIINIKI